MLITKTFVLNETHQLTLIINTNTNKCMYKTFFVKYYKNLLF